MGFWSSVCSGVSRACSCVKSAISTTAHHVSTFVTTKVAPVVKKTGEKVGGAIAAFGKWMQGEKGRIKPVKPTRDDDGKIIDMAALKRERQEIIDRIRDRIINDFNRVAVDLARESGQIFNDLKRRWEEQFENLDLSREAYDVGQAIADIDGAVKGKVKSMVSPSEPHFFKIVSFKKDSPQWDRAVDEWVCYVESEVRECFNQIVDSIFKRQVEGLLKKVDDYVSTSEKQLKKTVEELNRLVGKEQSGFQEKDTVIVNAVSMIHKCDYASDVLGSL